MFGSVVTNDIQAVTNSQQSPQRTVLEPLLFSVALSDMLSAIEPSTLTCYADDTKVSQISGGSY